MFSFPVRRISAIVFASLLLLPTPRGAARAGEVFAPNAFDRTSQSTTFFDTAFSDTTLSDALYLGNLRTVDKADAWQTRLWGQAYGDWNHRQVDSEAAGFRADTFGMMAGFHRRRNSRLTWGWAAGGSWISIDNDANAGGKDVDGFKTMLDAAFDAKDWRLVASAGYGYNSQSIRRRDYYGAFDGDNKAHLWGAGIEFQLKVNSGPFEMEPYARLDVASFSEKGYAERRISGTGSTRTFGSSSDESAAMTLGIRYRWRQTGHLVVWRPELTAAWFHEFGSDDLFRSSRLDPFPTYYTVPDSGNQRDHLLFSVGVVGHLGSTMDIFVRYTTDIADDYTAHAVHCGTNWKF